LRKVGRQVDIPKKMKAVLVHGIGDYRLEEIPVPKPEAGEVLVRVKAAGICAGDVKAFHGIRVWGSEGIPPYIETPVVPGHEFLGEVVALGEGAGEKYGLQIGDLAASEQIIPCGQCMFCKKGQYWMCEPHHIYGFKRNSAEGSWAEYMKYPARALNHKVPAHVKPEHGALIEPLACAIHAVERGNIQQGDTVVIAGMGPIGLCMLQVARLTKPGLLIAIDVKQYRLDLASRLGADVTLNAGETDVVDKVKSLTEGYGCDVYIDAAGSPSGVVQGLDMLRKLGTFVEFAVHGGPTSVDWSIIGDLKELNIHGAHLGPHCYEKAIDYIQSGEVNVEMLVSHTLPLDEYQQGLEIASKAEDSIKVVLIPHP
jgi:2-desacetyl-2-hydroxyethyl bacteriochlorophyllide A dehydrogenase